MGLLFARALKDVIDRTVDWLTSNSYLEMRHSGEEHRELTVVVDPVKAIREELDGVAKQSSSTSRCQPMGSPRMKEVFPLCLNQTLFGAREQPSISIYQPSGRTDALHCVQHRRTHARQLSGSLCGLR